MCKYFRSLSDYLWICCLFLLAACCDVAVSVSRQRVLAGVGIKCSFPLISSLAFDVSIGTSWVSKQTLLFKVLLIIAAFHSVSFIINICLLSLCWRGWALCGCFAMLQTRSTQREEPCCVSCSVLLTDTPVCSTPVVQEHFCCQWHCLASSPLGLFERLLCLALCWCYLGCFQEQHRTASSIPKTDTECKLQQDYF